MYQIVVLKYGKRVKSYEKQYETVRKANSAMPAIKRNWQKRDKFVTVRIKQVKER